jgi:hypothetical protein
LAEQITSGDFNGDGLTDLLFGALFISARNPANSNDGNTKNKKSSRCMKKYYLGKGNSQHEAARSFLYCLFTKFMLR